MSNQEKAPSIQGQLIKAESMLDALKELFTPEESGRELRLSSSASEGISHLLDHIANELDVAFELAYDIETQPNKPNFYIPKMFKQQGDNNE